MKDIHKDCQWQTRDEMDAPTNPLQYLTEALTRTSKEMSVNKLDAALYAVIVGWNDEAYKELQITHNWSDSEVTYLNQMHQNYIDTWGLYMKNIKL